MQLTDKIQRAIIKSSILHQNQTRKDNPFPFISHPYSVAFILSNYTNDEDIIVAGLLHDVLEDVPDYSDEDMKKEFGEKVYEIVKGVSEKKDPNDKNPDSVGSWKKRKDGYLDNLKKDGLGAMMVCCADKIHNLSSLMEAYKEQGESLWAKFNAPEDKKIWFYSEVLKILQERLDNPIVKELERVYGEAEVLFKVSQDRA
ncbi:MAG: HD domain-containing protein [bacterium]|nr:HD domain-containing protein [bacterium]